MVLTLYAHPMSTCGRRVASVLHEKKIPYTLVVPDLAAKEIKSDEWKKNQPFGQMPFINDDGFILFESRAIVRYLATKYSKSGTNLIPEELKGPQGEGLLSQAISIESFNFAPSVEGLTYQKFFRSLAGLDPIPAFVEKYESAMPEKLEGFESMLSKQKYMAGNNISFVDFFYLPYGQAITQLGYDYVTNEQKWPHVARWWKDISGREAWTKVKNGIPPSLE